MNTGRDRMSKQLQCLQKWFIIDRARVKIGGSWDNLVIALGPYIKKAGVIIKITASRGSVLCFRLAPPNRNSLSDVGNL